MYPTVKINLPRIKDNAQCIVSLAERNGISIWGVTKGVSADLQIAKTLLDAGVEGLADSRIKNLKKLSDLETKLMLLRSPMFSQVDEVVTYADISLNSEISIIKALNKAAKEQTKRHKIILMIDLGDRREGILPEQSLDTIKEVKALSNINLIGLGTNLACFMGILPTIDKMKELKQIKKKIDESFALDLTIISGGNSSSLPLLLNDDYQAEINQLRVGETILLGREVPSGDEFPGTVTNTFNLVAEVIEVKKKPTSTQGQQGENAFGERKDIIDKGTRRRAILALGKQDIAPTGLRPCNNKVIIEGASSDHLIVDVTNLKEVRVGTKLAFKMDYPCLLRAMTSPYLDREYIKD